jgi:hypothetical protein
MARRSLGEGGCDAGCAVSQELDPPLVSGRIQTRRLFPSSFVRRELFWELANASKPRGHSPEAVLGQGFCS